MKPQKVAHKTWFNSIRQFFKYHPEQLNRERENSRRRRQIQKGILKFTCSSV